MPPRTRRDARRRYRAHWDALEARCLLTGDAFTAPWCLGRLLPVPADYNGDGAVDLALFEVDSGEWLVAGGDLDAGQGYRLFRSPAQIPVAGDFNGDGRAEPAFFARDTGGWAFHPPGAAAWIVQFGNPVFGDYPAPADYDGDGIVDVGVFRPSEARWLAKLSGGGVLDEVFGTPGGADFPVPADYDGDGKADLAVFRVAEGRWLASLSAGGTLDQVFGEPGLVDLPAPADYDGDGKADLAVFRRSTEQWLIQGSTAGREDRSFDRATIPVQRVETPWVARHAAQAARAQLIREPIVFLGDSITDFWGDPNRAGVGQSVWLERLAPQNAANFGIASDSSRSVLWRIQNGALAGEPQVAVLLVGINDLLFQNRTPEEVARTITASVELIRELSPRTRILLMGVFPTDFEKEAPIRELVRQLNALLAPLDDGRHVRFLDIGDRFLEEDGGVAPGLMNDALHPSEFGYRVWADAIMEPIRRLRRQWLGEPRLDFDGDAKADLAVYRPSNSQWLGLLSGGSVLNVSFGNPDLSDIPVPGDYDGDGITDLAVFHPSLSLWIANLSGGGVLWTQFGAPNLLDIPVPGDYDGDGITDLAVFRPSEARWLAKLSGGGVLNQQFGAPNLADIPIPADYDGDGKTDLAVFRPSEARWLAKLSGGGVLSQQFGATHLADIPVPGDYDGDGKADLAVFRPGESRWLIKLSGGGSINRVFGAPNLLDVPVAAPIGSLKAILNTVASSLGINPSTVDLTFLTAFRWPRNSRS